MVVKFGNQMGGIKHQILKGEKTGYTGACGLCVVFGGVAKS